MGLQIVVDFFMMLTLTVVEVILTEQFHLIIPEIEKSEENHCLTVDSGSYQTFL